MVEKVLVTGGAGFIGSHIVDALVEKGLQVRVFDNLTPQVHGKEQKIPAYLNQNIEFILGDVRDYYALSKVLKDVDVVFHEAAAVGVGQSMYQIKQYVETNTMGAANLLHFVANEKHKIRKMIVASSMSVYGEGKYDCLKCGPSFPFLRPLAQLQKRQWEMRCEICGEPMTPLPTDEKKPMYPTSIYAITKRDHEEMFLATGFALRIPVIALRYFNVYGTRQALSNPYTGVCAIFSSRLLNGNAPVIFENGLQTRDLTHVSDIVQANMLALEAGKQADFQVFNVGTGKALSVLDVARALQNLLGKTEIKFDLPNKFRAGDIRHCFADISKIKRILNFSPKVDFNEGVKELVKWVSLQQAEDRVIEASREMENKKLIF